MHYQEFLDKMENKTYPTKESQLQAVRQRGDDIKHIRNPDKEVQMAAVLSDHLAITHIHNPDKEVQMVTVTRNGYMIRYIDNADRDVQYEAVKRNPMAIEYVNNPTKKMQMLAVTGNYLAINKIKTPSIKVQLEALRNCPSADVCILLSTFNSHVNKEVQIAVIKKNSHAIDYIFQPCNEAILEAIKQGNNCFERIKNPDEITVKKIKKIMLSKKNEKHY